MPIEDKDRLRAHPRLRPQLIPIKPHQKFLQKYLGSTRKRIVAAILFLAAAVGLGDWSWTVYQNTLPDVTARDSETDSTFLLPFIVQNKSTAFDMKNVELTCGIGTFFLGNGKQTMVMVAGLRSSQVNAVIPAGHPVNFPCDASQLVKFEGAKGINIMGLHADLPGVEPMKVTGINTTVSMKYKTLGWTRTYRSDPFNWTCTPQGCHWTKGPTVR
jgi:hypothetical protein